MGALVTTCPNCCRVHYIDPQAAHTTCHRCGCKYNVWEDAAEADDDEPDYGGAFDGHSVFSDADPGL